MTTPAVNVQCQSFIAANKGHGWGEHHQCPSMATVECRDFYDPQFVRYLCTGCVSGLYNRQAPWHEYDPSLHGVINQETRQREDRWPQVGAVRVYRRLEGG